MNPEFSDELNDAYDHCMKLCERGQLEDALPLAEKARRLGEQEFGPDHPISAGLLCLLADLYSSLGRESEAGPMYELVVAVYEKSLGPSDKRLIEPLEKLAAFYFAEGRFSEVAAMSLRALAILEETYGAESPEKLGSLNNLALAYRELKRYGEAEMLHTRALLIAEKAENVSQRALGFNLYNLALLYNERGRYPEALPLCQRALTVYENIFGNEQADLIPVLQTCAELLRETGDERGAAEMEARAKSIWESEVVDSAEQSVLRIEFLAYAAVIVITLLLFSKCSSSDPVGLFDDKPFIPPSPAAPVNVPREPQPSLLIQPGSGSSDLAHGLLDMSENYKSQGLHRRAEDTYRWVIALLENAPDARPQTLAATLDNYAGLLRRMDRLDETVMMETRAGFGRGGH